LFDVYRIEVLAIIIIAETQILNNNSVKDIVSNPEKFEMDINDVSVIVLIIEIGIIIIKDEVVNHQFILKHSIRMIENIGRINSSIF
jgi:hypothetical protein